MFVSIVEEVEVSGVFIGGFIFFTFIEDFGERVISVSSLERMFRIICFREMVSVLGGSCYWFFLFVCKI